MIVTVVVIAGTNAIRMTGVSPLQPSAEIHAPCDSEARSGRLPLSFGTAQSDSTPDEAGFAQHAIAADSSLELAGANAIPFRRPTWMRATHAPQVALPGFTMFAAAIHCDSENRATGGGITPRRSAQTSRSCGVLQQHADQHSEAPAQPHPHDSQG